MQQCSNATTNLMNQYGAKKIPFLFIIDFEAKKPVILKLSEIKNSQIKYYFNNKSNVKTINIEPKNIYFRKQPPTLKFYKKGFDIIKQNINKGNTYLLKSFRDRIGPQYFFIHIIGWRVIRQFQQFID